MPLNIVLRWGKTFWTKCKQLEHESPDGIFRWTAMLCIIITLSFNTSKFIIINANKYL